jgi:hydroxyacylglutathione hydrolase
MIFRQITHDDLGCASYLIGDEKAGVAAVVDPRFEIDEYLDLARYMGVSIEHVLETHNHADHVSGHGRLAAATGASIHVHCDADPEYEHEPFDDGWELELGATTVRALHTPGHRPEHTAFALIDTARSDEPWAVLTGDTLFVGDVARPDLAIEKSEGAKGIFHSLHDQLLKLPDHCEVWPGHLGGSMCGGPGMDMKVSTTIGYERANNPVLSIDDEDEFVKQALAKLGPQPPNFQAIVELNQGPLLTDGVELLRLAPRQVELKRAAGALLVDVRTDIQFDDAHIPGAVSIPLMRAGFGSKLAWLADREQEIVIVGRDDEDGRNAGRLAVAVGLRKLGGFLHGGMTSWRQENRPTESIERQTVQQLHERTQAGDQIQILDVRDDSEWAEGHIPGSVFRTWHEITELPDGLDPDRSIAVICGSGQRAATAASLIERFGAREVIHIADGGVPQWGRLGHPLEQSESVSATAFAGGELRAWKAELGE